MVAPNDSSIPPVSRDFVGVPLAILFATGEEITAAKNEDRDHLITTSAPLVSDDDAYLVLPDDIGDEIVDILADGDLELLNETFRDSLIVSGGLNREGGEVSLLIDCAVSPHDAFRENMPYAQEIKVGGDSDPVQFANRMDHCQCTMLSAFIDDEGLDSMLRAESYVGVSWRTGGGVSKDLVVSPTYAYSRRLSSGGVGVEFALFVEEDDLIALMRPARFTPP